MRNVTKNQATTLDTEPVKRGRGRPRKVDAMTGAQRQAAYRERQRAASINVTVTENNDQADQVQSLRESHERQVAVLRKQLARTEAELTALKAATASNGDAPDFEIMLKLLAMACERKPVKAQLAIRESDLWRNGVAGTSSVTDAQMKRIAAALAGKLT
jgi:hypothetical protein